MYKANVDRMEENAQLKVSAGDLNMCYLNRQGAQRLVNSRGLEVS